VITKSEKDRQTNRANKSTEASRAKHKFAVKRNSWPKTRGVAMNPVDHVRAHSSKLSKRILTVYSLTVVVTINILVKPRQSQDTLHRVKKLVLLQPDGQVYYAVPRRQRSRSCLYRVWGNSLPAFLRHVCRNVVLIWSESIHEKFMHLLIA
jgi:hypothetical protein